jgi:hypothetical protein
MNPTNTTGNPPKLIKPAVGPATPRGKVAKKLKTIKNPIT